ncbi:hypothetical protein DID75_01860 [Candidatus Marinamargulisbacteria bacterium SCGC AG-410-N11]|nr:hypothetical protein DID75_01860 [Candidatus Marinamargulisbacteria bacterium SCGC AG-410-N11]
MIKAVLVTLIIFFTTCLNAFEGVSSYGDIFTQSRRFNTDEKKIQEVQAHFIKNIFTDPLIKSMHVFDSDEDKEEGGSVFSSNNEYFDSILALEIAKDLAKRDILGLEKLIRKQSQ